MRELEVRMMSGELTSDSDSRVIGGSAILYDVRSQKLFYEGKEFYEVIQRGAIDEETLRSSDIKAYVDHNSNRLLARSYKGDGTLSLELREDGVYFALEAPNTSTGNEALELVRRGDIRGCSFAFWGAEDRWDKLEDGTYLRTITRIPHIDDVSIVVRPAYESTSVSVRGLQELLTEERAEEQAQQEPADIPESYYTELEEQV